MSKRTISSIAFFLVAFIIAAYQGVIANPAEEAEPPPPEAETVDLDTDTDLGGTQQPVPESQTSDTNATVVKVVDGDTMDVVFDDGMEARIRFLGVDTPETVDPRKTVQCFGKEASDFSKSTLTGARVLLEADPQADERDKYGRLLRNVYLEDGTDFNAFLVEQGYAHAYLSFPLDPERKAELKGLEDDARANGRGLWDPAACVGE